MQAHTKDMHEKEQLFPNNMIYGRSRQRTCQIWIRKSMDLPNLNLESHAISVTCIIKLIILQTEHNIFHIAHIIIHITLNVVHIIHSYAMRRWNHGIDIKTSQKLGLNIWDFNQGLCLSKHRICFIHSYVLHFISLQV